MKYKYTDFSVPVKEGETKFSFSVQEMGCCLQDHGARRSAVHEGGDRLFIRIPAHIHSKGVGSLSLLLVLIQIKNTKEGGDHFKLGK